MVLFLSNGIASTPSSAAQDSLYHESRQAMGTPVEIYLYAPSGERASVLFEAAYEEIERVEAALSTYRPTSEISRINAMASLGPVITDPEVFGLLERSFEYSRRSGGAFDVTVGPLAKAWGFFRDDGHYPSPDELSEARAKVGWRHVALNTAQRSIRFLTPGIELDLGGIGKGFALDCAARTLRRHGVARALLGAGQSSYVAIGAPVGAEGWPITVPSPHHAARALSTVQLRDRSLSTSGSNQKYFEVDGQRYSHIIDPRTGHPTQGMMQVTVTAPAATDSDALSTALFVLGPARATALIEAIDGTAALLVTGHEREGQVVAIEWTEAFAPWGR
jgi:thiamine biosynthesis lipoprotein